VAESVGVSAGAVGETMRRAKAVGVTSWAAVEEMTPSALEACLYPSTAVTAKAVPDGAWIHRERRRVGVTLELLHDEYLEQQPDGYQYSQFCEHYRRWLRQRSVSMRQVHQAGAKTFVDYSGKKPCIWDAKTGERIEVELFVAVLGASNLTYAEATATQRGPDWIGSHTRAFAYFGGVTAATVCDQLKPGVTLSCRYEPGIQRTYEEMAEHYGTTVLPARPRHPRDKPKVEGAVLIVQRWILARLRNETHFSLASLNERIAELLEDLNDRQMRVYRVSRRQLFEQLERAELKPLPTTRFVYGEWTHAKVNVDYHVEADGHYYSVPHTHLHAQVDVRVSAGTVEILRNGGRIASHVRSHQRGRHTTTPEHMPAAHRAHLEWSPSRIINWAGTIGPQTRALAEAILASRPHPEQGYRSCLGILRLGKRYGDSRLEAACARAMTAGARSYRHVDSILRRGLDRAPLPAPADEPARPLTAEPHENVRGPDHYN
jgi:transposase